MSGVAAKKWNWMTFSPKTAWHFPRFLDFDMLSAEARNRKKIMAIHLVLSPHRLFKGMSSWKRRKQKNILPSMFGALHLQKPNFLGANFEIHWNLKWNFCWEKPQKSTPAASSLTGRSATKCLILQYVQSAALTRGWIKSLSYSNYILVFDAQKQWS